MGYFYIVWSFVCLYFQILAVCLYPQLLNSRNLPVDVKQRAEWLLAICVGGSLGEACIFDVPLKLFHGFIYFFY